MKAFYRIISLLSLPLCLGIPTIVFVQLSGIGSEELNPPVSRAEIANNRFMVVYCFCLMGSIISALYFLRSWVIGGCRLSHSCRLMWRVIWRSSSGLLFLGLSALTALILFFWCDQLFVGARPYVPLIGAVTTINIFVMLMSSPVAIILGQSNPAPGRSVRLGSMILAPYRVVSLIRKNAAKGTYHNTFVNEVRTRSGDRWKTQVTELCELSPLIILDSRGSSDPVEFEVEHIINQGLFGKTLLIADWDSDGGGPILEGSFKMLKGHVLIIRSDHFQHWLRFYHKRLNSVGYQLGVIQRMMAQGLLSKREFQNFTTGFFDSDIDDRSVARWL